MTVSTVRRALGEALALVFPVECAGCGAVDEQVCASCRQLLRATDARRRRIACPGGDVDVWSGLSFEGVPARVLRAFKEDGRTALARRLAPALAVATAAATAHAGGTEIVVVPVPTSRAAMRRRGYRAVELIAARAGLRPRRILRLTRAPGDQRALGRAARARNVAGSMRAVIPGPLRVLIVDDVVTTGATLAEAVRALRDAGAEVVGAVTVAATPRRSSGAMDTGETHT